jgi:ComF family protein
MKITEWILGCIYPCRCVVCDSVVALKNQNICPGCREKLSVMEGFHCKHCGKFIEREEEEYCADCQRFRHRFDEGFGVFPYSGWVKESMMRFKFHGRKEYGDFYGRAIAAAAGERIRRWKPQVIVPVPMHGKKERLRGYNQAEVLARSLGKQMSLPVRTDLVRRVHETRPQKELSRDMRRKNLRQAFETEDTAGGYSRILLVDDIYTTGSTADAVASGLKLKGVKSVFIVTACTGHGF